MKSFMPYLEIKTTDETKSYTYTLKGEENLKKLPEIIDSIRSLGGRVKKAKYETDDRECEIKFRLCGEKLGMLAEQLKIILKFKKDKKIDFKYSVEGCTRV